MARALKLLWKAWPVHPCFRVRPDGDYGCDPQALKAEARPRANLVVLGCLEHFNLHSLFLSDDLNFWDSTFLLIAV